MSWLVFKRTKQSTCLQRLFRARQPIELKCYVKKKKLAKLIVPTVKANVHYILPKIAVSANSLKDVFFFFFVQILVIQTLCIKEIVFCLIFTILHFAP